MNMYWMIAAAETEATASNTEQPVVTAEPIVPTREIATSQMAYPAEPVPAPFATPCFLYSIILIILILHIFLTFKLRMELAISRGIRPFSFALISLIPVYGPFKAFRLLIKPNVALESEIKELKNRITLLESNAGNR
jgi:hypothetical protein